MIVLYRRRKFVVAVREKQGRKWVDRRILEVPIEGALTEEDLQKIPLVERPMMLAKFHEQQRAYRRHVALSSMGRIHKATQCILTEMDTGQAQDPFAPELIERLADDLRKLFNVVSRHKKGQVADGQPVART